MIDRPLLVREKKRIQQPTFWKDLLSLEKSDKKVVKSLPIIEKILISRLLEGDSSAFSTIFTAYYRDLVIFAIRFTHDSNESEEIVQNTFVKLWEDHESIRINSSLKSYLLKSVQNKCIDWLRHRKIVNIHDSKVLINSVEYESNTDNYLLQSELQEQIDSALGKLPQEVSEAFRMNRYKGLKYHEIAKIMNVSERTIEVYIGKALALLRKYLQEYFLAIICLTGIFSIFVL